MIDQETAPKPGLRASNTHETLKPREVRTATISEGVADALGLTIDDKGTLHAKSIFESTGDAVVRETDLFAEQIEKFQPKPETIFRPERYIPEVKPRDLGEFKLASPLPEPQKAVGVRVPIKPHYGSIGNLVMGDQPVPISTKTLEERVQRLEEQIDALLERLSRFNFKASHKI